MENKNKGKNILAISLVPTHPQIAGNRIRTYSLLKQLQNLGYKIHFLYIKGEKNIYLKEDIGDIRAMKKCWDEFYSVGPEMSDIIRRIDKNIGKVGIFLRKYFPKIYGLIRPKEIKNSYEKSKEAFYEVDFYYNKRAEKYIRKLKRKVKFDYVISEFIFTSKYLELFGKDALKILDTHDCFVSKYRHYAKRDKKMQGLIKEEEISMNRADVIIAIQDKEKKEFDKLTQGRKEVITIGHIVKLYKPDKERKSGKNIVFIGSGFHANYESKDWFIYSVFPKIKKKILDARIFFVGSVCDRVLDNSGVIKLGVVKNLDKVYEIADVIISPILLGSGLKIKSIEALGHGKPVVMSKHAAIGLEKGIGKAFIAQDNPEKFANAVVKILNNKKYADNLSNEAYKFAEKYNKEQVKKIKRLLRN